MFGILQSGAAGSYAMNWLGPRILEKNYETGFSVAYLVKDLEIAIDECRKMNCSLPNTALMVQLYRGLMANGGGN